MVSHVHNSRVETAVCEQRRLDDLVLFFLAQAELGQIALGLKIGFVNRDDSKGKVRFRGLNSTLIPEPHGERFLQDGRIGPQVGLMTLDRHIAGTVTRWADRPKDRAFELHQIALPGIAVKFAVNIGEATKHKLVWMRKNNVGKREREGREGASPLLKSGPSGIWPI